MVIYFSGTGNSKWVAKKIAENLNDKIFEITDRIDLHDIENEKQLGIVFPMHTFYIPKIVLDFLVKIKDKKIPYKFAIASCAGEPANYIGILEKITEFNYITYIQMPNNDVFHLNVASIDEAQKTIQNAEGKIKEISKDIINKENRKQKIKTSRKIMSFFGKRINKILTNRTKPFYADDKCVSCGICELVCPIKSIKMDDLRPKWNDKCLVCASCINRCPKQAIQYGDSTKKRDRYYLEKTIN